MRLDLCRVSLMYAVLQEASQMLSQAALKGELEAYQQQLEDYKVKTTDPLVVGDFLNTV